MLNTKAIKPISQINPIETENLIDDNKNISEQPKEIVKDQSNIPVEQQIVDQPKQIEKVEQQFPKQYGNGIKENYVKFDDNSNTYAIYEYNNYVCSFSNQDIINYLFDHNTSSNANLCIKKYLLIITFNDNEFELNILNTILTSDLDIMVKIQNFVYDTIKNKIINVNLNDENDVEQQDDVLLVFFYQLIMFMFKNISVYEQSFDDNKISKLFSGLAFRFSSLILHNVKSINNYIDDNIALLDKLDKQQNGGNDSESDNNTNDLQDFLSISNSDSDSDSNSSSDSDSSSKSNSSSKSSSKSESDSESESSDSLLSESSIKYKQLESSDETSNSELPHDTINVSKSTKSTKSEETSHSNKKSYNMHSAYNNGKIYNQNI